MLAGSREIQAVSASRSNVMQAAERTPRGQVMGGRTVTPRWRPGGARASFGCSRGPASDGRAWAPSTAVSGQASGAVSGDGEQAGPGHGRPTAVACQGCRVCSSYLGAIAMDDVKRQLARWIEEDRHEIVEFLCDFVRAKSPNPPGDTTLAAAHVTRFLTAQGVPFRVIAPEPTMPNIVASFEGARPGGHLVLNGHMDVFPADEKNERWSHGPWSGAIADGKIYGRGAADMKAGTSASIFTFCYLQRVRAHLGGRLT